MIHVPYPLFVVVVAASLGQVAARAVERGAAPETCAAETKGCDR
ncbi:MAG: hypothetical protein ACYCVO_02970 [Acidimicrobiales bacterium]